MKLSHIIQLDNKVFCTSKRTPDPNTMESLCYVDSKNSFGATIRSRFSGEVEQISEDKWRLISFDIK